MLEVTGLSKSFHTNRILRSVDFNVWKGEVHALIGENGAGKSTLVNIIAGIHQRDEGRIVFDGRDVDFSHPLEAMKAGISVVHQELSLVPNATVTENIYLRREMTNWLGLNDWGAMNAEAAKVISRMGIDIDPTALAGSLSVGMQQLVEVAKAIALGAKLIIMDEPTSSLSEKETAELFKVVADLKSQGLGIVFISHKLSELFAIADRITVLRDGQLIATKPTSELTTEEVIRMMVGRHLGDLYPPKSSKIGETIFVCRNLSRFGSVREIDFEVRAGEVLGIAGLVGSGRTEAMRALVNADRRTTGNFQVGGEPTNIENPDSAIEQGIVYVSEDRKGSGLFLSFDIASNIGSSRLDGYTDGLGLFDFRKLREKASRYIADMDIRPANDAAKVGNLSGGNQQKVLISKSVEAKPRILIVDEPTRGVDVGAKSLIHSKLRDLAESGVGVVVISSEMPEVIGMSDRILVFRNGGISAVLDNSQGQVTQEAIMTHAAHL